jgi:hypothetical protein
MTAKQIYCEGIRSFKPHEKAPAFVLGSVIITLEDLTQFFKDNPNYLRDYQGKKQIRLSALQSDKTGINFQVDTYGLEPKSEPNFTPPTSGGEEVEPLPF